MSGKVLDVGSNMGQREQMREVAVSSSSQAHRAITVSTATDMQRDAPQLVCLAFTVQPLLPAVQCFVGESYV